MAIQVGAEDHITNLLQVVVCRTHPIGVKPYTLPLSSGARRQGATARRLVTMRTWYNKWGRFHL